MTKFLEVHIKINGLDRFSDKFPGSSHARELIDILHIGSAKTLVGRMPAHRGFPFKELYWKMKNLIGKGKYDFVRNGHTYFGYWKEITLFRRDCH